MLKSVKMLALSAAVAFAGSAQAEEATKLVTIVTASEAQSQLMGMVLTMNAAKAGANTHILLCGPAADIALKDAPESATAPQPPKKMSPQGLMKILMEKQGTTVEVCAIYLPGKGAEASILIDGVTAAKPGAMAERIIAPNTQVLSF